MMSTRASGKRKRLNNNTIKSKKFKASRSLADKRSKSSAKYQSITSSSISIHDDSSLEKDPLTIDSADESEQERVCTSKVVDANSKNSNVKKGPLNSSVIPKVSAAEDELTTEAAYKKLEAVISSCSPIVERVSKTTDRNISSFRNNEGSVLRDTEDQLILPTPLSQVTPTTNRVASSHSSRMNRSQCHADQHLTPTTNVRNTLNRAQLSFTPATTSAYKKGSSGVQRVTNDQLFNINRNIYGTTKTIGSSSNAQSTSTNHVNASQPIASFSSNNLSLLESIPEYRNLKKELAQERQRCATWSEDYAKLRTEFENYRAASFPRPSVDGLNFLLQLVENLTVSSTSIDSRTHQDFAVVIGLSEEQLADCIHRNPQRAALMVFNTLYPTYQDRANLINIKTFQKNKFELMNDIFVFARKCNPSTVYTIEQMQSAFNGSIRQARHQLTRLNNMDLILPPIDNQNELVDEDDIEEIIDNNNSVMDVHQQNGNYNQSTDSSDNEPNNRMDQ